MVYGSATEGKIIFEEEVVESLLPTVAVSAELHLAPEARSCAAQILHSQEPHPLLDLGPRPQKRPGRPLQQRGRGRGGLRGRRGRPRKTVACYMDLDPSDEEGEASPAPLPPPHEEQSASSRLQDLEAPDPFQLSGVIFFKPWVKTRPFSTSFAQIISSQGMGLYLEMDLHGCVF